MNVVHRASFGYEFAALKPHVTVGNLRLCCNYCGQFAPDLLSMLGSGGSNSVPNKKALLNVTPADKLNETLQELFWTFVFKLPSCIVDLSTLLHCSAISYPTQKVPRLCKPLIFSWFIKNTEVLRSSLSILKILKIDKDYKAIGLEKYFKLFFRSFLNCKKIEFRLWVCFQLWAYLHESTSVSFT